MDNNLTTLTHDLRTPLAALKLATSLLVSLRHAESAPDEEVLIACLQHNVARIERIADELAALVAQRAT